MSKNELPQEVSHQIELLADESKSLKEKLEYISRIGKQVRKREEILEKSELPQVSHFELLLQELQDSSDVQKNYFAIVGATACNDIQRVLNLTKSDESWHRLPVTIQMKVLKGLTEMSLSEQQLKQIVLDKQFKNINEVPRFRRYFLKNITINKNRYKEVKKNLTKFFLNLTLEVNKIHGPKEALPLLSECDLSEKETAEMVSCELKIFKITDLVHISLLAKRNPEFLLFLIEKELEKCKEDHFMTTYNNYSSHFNCLVKLRNPKILKRILQLLEKYPAKKSSKTLPTFMNSTYRLFLSSIPKDFLDFYKSHMVDGKVYCQSMYDSQYEIFFNAIQMLEYFPVSDAASLCSIYIEGGSEANRCVSKFLSCPYLKRRYMMKKLTDLFKQLFEKHGKKIVIDMLTQQVGFYSLSSYPALVRLDLAERVKQERESSIGLLSPVENVRYYGYLEYNASNMKKLQEEAFKPDVDIRSLAYRQMLASSLEQDKFKEETIEFISKKIKNEQSVVRHDVIQFLSHSANRYDDPIILEQLLLPIFNSFDKNSSDLKKTVKQIAVKLLESCDSSKNKDFENSPKAKLAIEILRKAIENAEATAVSDVVTYRRRGGRRRGGRRPSRNNASAPTLFKPIFTGGEEFGRWIVSKLSDLLQAAVKQGELHKVITIVLFDKKCWENEHVLQCFENIFTVEYFAEKFDEEKFENHLRSLTFLYLKDEKKRLERVKRLLSIDPSFFTFPIIQRILSINDSQTFAQYFYSGKRITKQAISKNEKIEIRYVRGNSSIALNLSVLRAIAPTLSAKTRDLLLSHIVDYIQNELVDKETTHIKRKYIKCAAILQLEEEPKELLLKILDEYISSEDEAFSLSSASAYGFFGHPFKYLERLLDLIAANNAKAVSGAIARVRSYSNEMKTLEVIKNLLQGKEIKKKGVSVQKEIIRLCRLFANNATIVVEQIFEPFWNGKLQTHNDVRSVIVTASAQFLKVAPDNEKIWKILNEATQDSYKEIPKVLFSISTRGFSWNVLNKISEIQLKCLDHKDHEVSLHAWKSIWLKYGTDAKITQIAINNLRNVHIQLYQMNHVIECLMSCIKENPSNAESIVGLLEEIATNKSYKEQDEKNNAQLFDLPVQSMLSVLADQLIRNTLVKPLDIPNKKKWVEKVANYLAQYSCGLVVRAGILSFAAWNLDDKQDYYDGCKAVLAIVEKNTNKDDASIVYVLNKTAKKLSDILIGYRTCTRTEIALDFCEDVSTKSNDLYAQIFGVNIISKLSFRLWDERFKSIIRAMRNSPHFPVKQAAFETTKDGRANTFFY